MTSSPAERTETKRGDREGRRRDILRAAAEILETKGYGELNMRDVASRAGVSAGTPYSYFASKEEIFATLLIRRFEDLTERFDRMAEQSADLAELMRAVIPAITEMQRDLGQHVTAWERAADDSEEVTVRLGAAFSDAIAALERAVRKTASRMGLALDDSSCSRPLLWSTVVGVANINVAGVERLCAYERSDLVELAARMIERGLTEPAVRDSSGPKG